MVSIIIPALNEERYLPLLLDSIRRQNFRDYEIIVADANSKDRTRAIAEKAGCKVVSGGLPAVGRNEGAKAACGDLFLFLDADVRLPDDFLGNSLKEFSERGLGVASYALIPPKRVHRFLLDISYNIPARVLESILPHGGMGIMVKREVFEKLGGFDPTIKVAEDMHLVREAEKLSRFGILRSAPLFISPRRFERDGWVRTYLKFLFFEFHMILVGPVRSRLVPYRFNHYEKDLS